MRGSFTSPKRDNFPLEERFERGKRLLALHWDEETTSPQTGARTAAGQIHRPSAPLNHALVLRCQGSILTLLFMSSGNSFTLLFNGRLTSELMIIEENKQNRQGHCWPCHDCCSSKTYSITRTVSNACVNATVFA